MSIDYSTGDYPHLVNGDPVSVLKVMKSGAGWYLGRSYFDTEFGFEGPYSRESGYFTTEESAKSSLEDNTWAYRDAPENRHVSLLEDHPGENT